MAPITLNRENRNDLFGLCSEIAEIFRKEHFNVSIYPEHLDDMDKIDKTDLNLIICGVGDARRGFFRVIDMLIEQGYKGISNGTCYHLSGEESIDNYCLFNIGGKRVKIRDRTILDNQKVLVFCLGLLDAQDCIHPHPEGCGFLHQQS